MNLAGRYVALDAIRGFALIGVVAVNAAFFVAPLPAVLNPALAPLAQSEADALAWFATYVFFEFKSITLFSMLFGVSVYLVGGERSDAHKGAALRRRLAWLCAFGLAHGALIWFGDILLSYALAGFVAALTRSWRARTLLIVGGALFFASLAIVGTLTVFMSSLGHEALEASWRPSAAALATSIEPYRAGLWSALLANFGAWIEFQLQTLILLTPRTLGLMLIGLGLFKIGFLRGESSTRAYALTAAAGAAALAALSWRGVALMAAGWPVEAMQGVDAFAMAALSPLISLFYASLVILVIRAALVRSIVAALAAAGRMAFTNYLTQSLVLSTLAWSGRGLGLYGSISRSEIVLIALGLFAAQVLFSLAWLHRFEHGPFEWLWRKLTYPQGPAQTRAQASMALSPAIEAVALSKRFRSMAAVENVDLCVPRGAVFGFLGPNGAGKTTTIRLILGLLRPSAGTLLVCGHDMASERISAARVTGALLDARSCYDQLSGRENLEITRRLLGVGPKEVDRVLSMVDLKRAASRKAGHYSLGMRQRLGLARALLGSPALLVLDEPLNGLDPEGIDDMRRLIRELPAAGVTVFLSSHLLSEVEQTASHVGLMRQGRLVFQGRLDQALASSAPDLFVRVDRPEAALQFAMRAGYRAQAAHGGMVLTQCNAVDLARALHEAGFGIIELTPRPQSLERLYRALAET